MELSYCYQVIDHVQVHYAEVEREEKQTVGRLFCTVAPDAVPIEHAPILYLHGNLGSHRWFSGVMDVPGRRVVAPDLPNFGKSGPLGSCTISAYGKFVIELIDELDLESVVLVGHSLGAAVAMEAAVTRPELLSALCLIDPPPIDGLVTPESHYPFIEALRTDRNLLKQALRTVVPTLADEDLFQQLVSDAGQMDGACFPGHARALGEADFTTRADRFRKPVLCLVGELDNLISVEMAERTAAAFGAAAAVLKGVGHSVTVEHPSLFLDHFGRFLDGLADG